MSRRDPPEVRQRRGSPAPVKGRCGWKLALTDPPRYCLKWSKPGGNGHCGRNGHHAAPTGALAASLKGGPRSRYAFLNPRILLALEAELASEQLLDLREDVALLETLKQERLRMLELGASAEELQAGVAAARAAKGPRARAAALDALEALVTRAAAVPEAIVGASDAIERKARMVERQQRLMAEREDLVPARTVTQMLAGVASLVKEFIPDERRRFEFGRRFLGYLGSRFRQADLPAGPGAGRGSVVDAEPGDRE